MRQRDDGADSTTHNTQYINMDYSQLSLLLLLSIASTVAVAVAVTVFRTFTSIVVDVAVTGFHNSDVTVAAVVVAVTVFTLLLLSIVSLLLLPLQGFTALLLRLLLSKASKVCRCCCYYVSHSAVAFNSIVVAVAVTGFHSSAVTAVAFHSI
jgi:hypothetical protein